MTIELHDEFEIPRHVRSQQIDGEMFLLNIETGVYFGLNEIGVDVWEHLETHGNLDNLGDRLSVEYEIEKLRIMQDIVSLIADLEEHGLVVKKVDAD